LKEVEAMLPFVAEDVVQIMGIGVDEESLLVGEGRITTLPGGTLHGVVIAEGTMSLAVLQSHDDGYVLYKPLMLDDPPVSKIGDAVGQFILWLTECLRQPPPI
jgi:hypothetical protein